MGSRGQTQVKPNDGRGASLEMKGFGYKNKQSGTLNLNDNLNSKFNPLSL